MKNIEHKKGVSFLLTPFENETVYLVDDIYTTVPFVFFIR
jgi:predicted amidophosphoribosyltransferase